MVFFLCIPCLVLLSYFAIAGLFFPKYRIYIREAWKCFIDKLKGGKCSVSFDNRIRLSFSMWLSKRGFDELGKFFYNKKNFNITLIISMIMFSIISTYLFIILINYLINPSCVDNVCV